MNDRADRIPTLADIQADVLHWYEVLVQPGTGKPCRLTSPAAHSLSGEIVLCGHVIDSMDKPPVSRLFRHDAPSGALARLTDLPGDEVGPRFAPGGDRIVFRYREPGTDLFGVGLWDPVRGSATWTRLPGSAEQLEWSSDGLHVIALVADPGAASASTQGATSTATDREALPTWHPEIDDGASPPKRRLLVMTPEGSDIRTVEALVNIWEFSVAGPGAVIAVASDDPEEDAWYRARLCLIDLESGDADTLHVPARQISAISANGDGSRIAFIEGLASDRGLVAGDLFCIDRKQTGVRALATAETDISWTGWHRGHLIAAGIRRDEVVILDVGPDTGDVSTIWSQEAISAGKHHPECALLPGLQPSCAVIVQSVVTPDQLLVASGGEERALWSISTPDVQSLIADYGPQRHRAASWSATDDGEQIDGWLHVPEGPGPFPLVTVIHGGPVFRATPRHLLDYALQATLARYGFAQFMPNPRGSIGRGQGYAEAILGKMGDRDGLDVLAGIDALVTCGIADPARLAVTGISHGGFMSCWLVTQDTRFKAGAAVAPITDWTSQRLTSDIPSFNGLFVGHPSCGLPSPIDHVERVEAKMLIIGGGRDRCTSPVQAEEFHRALRLAGKASTLLVYPEEGHGIRSNPSAIVDHLARITDFFCRHVR